MPIRLDTRRPDFGARFTAFLGTKREAAARTSGLSLPPGAGTTITRRPTPATFAGTAFISTEDG